MKNILRVRQAHRIPSPETCPTETQGEADLVERAKKDPAAFGALFELYYGPIISYAFRRTLDMHVAEDVTANTFLKALKGIGRYRHKAPFRAWLFKIATNELRMHWRYARRHSRQREGQNWRTYVGNSVSIVPKVIDQQEIAEAMERFERLRNALLELPEPYQSALVLRYFEKFTYEEVSVVLGKRCGTVKSLISRGIRRLQERLA